MAMAKYSFTLLLLLFFSAVNAEDALNPNEQWWDKDWWENGQLLNATNYVGGEIIDEKTVSYYDDGSIELINFYENDEIVNQNYYEKGEIFKDPYE